MNELLLNAVDPLYQWFLALGDFDETQLRHMERTTVMGTPSGYVVAAG